MKANYKLKISLKFVLGFGIILISALISYIFIYNMLIENEKISSDVHNNIMPSVSGLNKYSLTLLESKDLIKHWVSTQSDNNTLKKKRLISIIDSIIPRNKKNLKKLSHFWTKEDKESLNNALNQTEAIKKQYSKIMEQLATFDQYNNEYTAKQAIDELQEGNPLMELNDSVLSQLSKLRNKKRYEILRASNAIKTSLDNFKTRIIFSVGTLFFLIIIISFLTARSLIVPINYLKKILISMSKGELPNKKIDTATDETGQMGAALNELISGLKQKAVFASEIGKNNFSKDLELAGKKDVLGNSLIQMRESLVAASKDAELRRIENQQRSWASTGLAEFNEIIREHSKTLETFTSVTINKLTNYLSAQVGGLYILNNDTEKPYLELSAFYAYGRQRFEEKIIQLGENLVGQSVLEKDTIYMTDIPDDYVYISSGLGKDTPKSLLIVPLKLNEEVHGVVEIASFNIIEKYQIDFVEKTGEILASTIANIKINIQTTKLLEESNEKSEKLAEQEEESKISISNLERKVAKMEKEAKEIKSKYKRIEEEYKNELNTFTKKIKLNEDAITDVSNLYDEKNEIVNSSLAIVETNTTGEIIKVNSIFIDIAKIAKSDIIGKPLTYFIDKKIAGSVDYLDIWKNLKLGIKSTKVITEYGFSGKQVTLLENFLPVVDNNNNIYKIIISSINISDILKK